MDAVGVGLGLKRDPVQAVREAIQQANIKLSRKNIALAVVFSSADLSSAVLLKAINIYLEATPVIGCSGAAIITNQGIFKHGVVIMLLAHTKDVYFNTACVTNVKTKTSLSAGEELGEKLLYGVRDIPRDISIIFSDGLINDGSSLVYGLQEKLGRSFPLIGASASDNLAFKKTYIYFNREAISDAACGILWGGKLNFGLGIKHGWKPLGKPHIVTRSRDNIVYEIDGASAISLYEEYFSYDLARLKKEMKRISIFYPIGIYLPGEEEYILRNILSIEENGSLVFQGNVPEESQIRLMIGTKESCLSATYQAVDEAKNGLFGRQVSFALIFDSISRYMLLGRQANKELDIIKGVMGKDTPLIGLYTYGEQAPLKAINYQGRAHFHNQTITVLAIGG